MKKKKQNNNHSNKKKIKNRHSQKLTVANLLIVLPVFIKSESQVQLSTSPLTDFYLNIVEPLPHFTSNLFPF
jgi:hypothetical protein